MKTVDELALDYTCINEHCCEVCAGEGFVAGYTFAQDHTELQWISVTDRLPNEDEDVLVFGKVLNDAPNVLGVRRLYNGKIESTCTWEAEDGYVFTESDVTHWMPLPQAPNEN